MCAVWSGSRRGGESRRGRGVTTVGGEATASSSRAVVAAGLTNFCNVCMCRMNCCSTTRLFFLTPFSTGLEFGYPSGYQKEGRNCWNVRGIPGVFQIKYSDTPWHATRSQAAAASGMFFMKYFSNFVQKSHHHQSGLCSSLWPWEGVYVVCRFELFFFCVLSARHHNIRRGKGIDGSSCCCLRIGDTRDGRSFTCRRVIVAT